LLKSIYEVNSNLTGLLDLSGLAWSSYQRW